VGVTPGDYGPVRVLDGEHRGKVGYYDDDDGREAIVYFGEPFLSDYVLIPRAVLEKVAVTSLELERWKRKYPLAGELARPAVSAARDP
jgi:hypothetical protein